MEIIKHLLVLLLSCALHYKLYIHGGKHLLHHICHQIKALLICQTRNHSNQHGILIHSQTILLLQLTLINDLSTQFPYRKMLIQICILHRIKDIIIYTVYNASQMPAPLKHQAIQALSALRCTDFICICRTDSRNLICIYYAAL